MASQGRDRLTCLVPFCVALLLLAAGCKRDTTRDTAALKASLAQYEQMVLIMDSHGIAHLYAPDGVLKNPDKTVRGTEAIERFLHGFDEYKVLAYSAVADTTRVNGDTAYQSARTASVCASRLPTPSTYTCGSASSGSSAETAG